MVIGGGRPEPGVGSLGSLTNRVSRRVRPALLRPWRAAMVARSRDATAQLTTTNSLVLAPHPDDESLGCGATIARKRAAHADVWIVCASDGRGSHPRSALPPGRMAELRADELVQAAARLGVVRERVRFLGHHSGTLHQHVDTLADQIRDLVRESGVREVLVTWIRDPHPDHRALSIAARMAVADRPDVRLLEYPIWGWVEGPWTREPHPSPLRRALRFALEPVETLTPRPLGVSCGPYRGAKWAAIREHRTQVVNVTGEPDYGTLGPGVLGPLTSRRELFLPVEH